MISREEQNKPGFVEQGGTAVKPLLDFWSEENRAAIFRPKK
jgi:hypothetical protein